MASQDGYSIDQGVWEGVHYDTRSETFVSILFQQDGTISLETLDEEIIHTYDRQQGFIADREYFVPVSEDVQEQPVKAAREIFEYGIKAIEDWGAAPGEFRKSDLIYLQETTDIQITDSR